MEQYNRRRSSHLARVFSLYEELPSHFRFCLFNIFFILMIFALMCIVELGLDIQLFKRTALKNSRVLIWLPPMSAASICIFMFCLFTIVYFIESYLIKSNKFWFQFGTFCIYGALVFFFALVLVMPWFFVSFIIVHDVYSIILQVAPVLFYQMCGYLVLSLFLIIFVAWVVGWIILEKILVATGLRKRISEVQHPMKIENDDQRISTSVTNGTPIKYEQLVLDSDVNLESSYK
ncbi:Transmembrane domain-containing protein [Spironucleus salmonicida]|uniref:Transmembrane domain-containing protein n=1 Tax=Spironucleus salmonicida TaxID=348837 RepID=V6LE76_9EUKA|nr:Transmembrane domain-containing protein [Spironucleus salmonicida]|eukprot:EST42805.1 Transmembrane domain-containing protein [Spironucleus salmonicida]